MNDFLYASPTRFVFGKTALKNLATETRTLGETVLFHYGEGSIKKTGLYRKIKALLTKANIKYVELGGVQPNPTLSLVREGIRLCRSEKVSGILAVGGGSVIDSAKAIAAGVPYSGDVWKFYTGKAKVSKALPVGVVLTIPAAGSEGSGGSVITDEKTQSKFDCVSDVLRPVFALLNPEFTFTLPPYHTAAGVVDMISHVMERYFTNTTAVDLTDRLCESVIRTIIKHAPAVFANPEDYEARAEIMLAGTLAHTDIVGLGREGDWASHMIEHELSAQYHVIHGAGLSVVFPAWMTYVRKKNLSRFVQFALRVWNIDYTAGKEDEIALEGIRRLREFYKSIGMPISLKDLEITDNRYELMAKKALRRGPLGALRKLESKDIIAIYKLCAKANIS